MINLSKLNIPTLKVEQSTQDSTANGYIALDSEKKNRILLSQKAVKSLNIDEKSLTKDVKAFALIFPQPNTMSEELKIDWCIGQFEEDNSSIKPGGGYPAYKMAKYNKTSRSITSKTMFKIVSENFKTSRILIEPTDNPSIFKLVEEVTATEDTNVKDTTNVVVADSSNEVQEFLNENILNKEEE